MTEAANPAAPAEHPAPTPAGGAVSIAASWAAGRIVDCRLTSRRPDAARLLVGKTPPEVLLLVPRLFSLCGQAQRAVAAAALDAAGGRSTPEPAGLAATLRREAIGEHLWRLMIDWPAALARGAAVDAAGGALAPLPHGDPRPSPQRESRRPSHGGSFQLSHRDSLQSQKKQRDAAFAAWYRRLRSPEPDAELAAALGAGVPRSLLATLLDAVPDWERPLTQTPTYLPDFDQTLADELLRRPAPSFAAAPTWRGGAAEVGALARFAAAPEVLALQAAGQSLAARLTARWLALQDDIAGLGGAAGADPAVAAVAAGDGLGYAWTATARGPLCHRVVLAGNRVADYAVIAPTEWNFHPASAWAAALIGVRAESREMAENLVRLWALALDPCVPVQLHLSEEN
ncbi:MAG TPA: nickel-dependent hydrogenase large subunit [Rhodocyclaceae bacterium]|nr:nickel-dependent hydrogenase large subunit [Rhodocyclaceae bacterium]